MESLSSPSHHPFLAHCFTQPRTTPQLHFPMKSPKNNRYKLLFHAASPAAHRAPKNTRISAVAEAEAAAASAGGDLTGLVQNGVLLLSVYWVANFVVPGLMSKGFEPAASETEKETEEEAIHGGEMMKQGTNVQANVKAKRRSRGMKKTASSR